MRYLLYLSAVLLFAACGRGPSYHADTDKRDNRRTIQLAQFSVKVNGGWEKYELTDSTGFIIRNKDSIIYATGRKVQLLNVGTDDSLQRYITADINGLEAVLTIPVRGKQGVSAVSIALHKGQNLLMVSHSGEKEHELLQLFSTIQFPGQSDPQLTADIDITDFANGYASLYDGRAIFQANCASCHNLIKDATGPALRGYLITHRSPDWLYHFVADRSFPLDKEAREMVKKWNGLQCPKFPQLNRQQVMSIFSYADYLPGCVFTD